MRILSLLPPIMLTGRPSNDRLSSAGSIFFSSLLGSTFSLPQTQFFPQFSSWKKGFFQGSLLKKGQPAAGQVLSEAGRLSGRFSIVLRVNEAGLWGSRVARLNRNGKSGMGPAADDCLSVTAEVFAAGAGTWLRN
jgi:hypothetical protein